MTWYFCYFVNAKFGETYFRPEECVNFDILNASCEDVTVHVGSQHPIHDIGMHLKAYGLGTAIILETTNEKDVTLLKLFGDSVINESKFRPDSKPTLQLIVQAKNFSKMNLICQDLEIARHHQQCSREDMDETIRVIQRQADKLVRMVDILQETMSDAFKQSTNVFVQSCVDEINTQTNRHRETTKNTAALRKQLMRAFSNHVIYTNPNGGFK